MLSGRRASRLATTNGGTPGVRNRAAQRPDPDWTSDTAGDSR